MTAPFIGSEALASGTLTRHALRSRFSAIYPDVYLPRNAEITPAIRAYAGWLWSGRRGIIAGRSAAALYGAKWVKGDLPAQLLWTNRHAPSGIDIWSESVDEDEIATIDGMLVTAPVRTAFDIARRGQRVSAIAAIDALARATKLEIDDVSALTQRYAGRRGVRRARGILPLIDPGAESPKETWLRLLLISNGFPRPATQIPVRNEYGVLVATLDMGWEELKIAAEYAGDHHRLDRVQFNKDIRRTEILNELGWIHIWVTVADAEGDIVRRIRAAFARRACTQGAISA